MSNKFKFKNTFGWAGFILSAAVRMCVIYKALSVIFDKAAPIDPKNIPLIISLGIQSCFCIFSATIALICVAIKFILFD